MNDNGTAPAPTVQMGLRSLIRSPLFWLTSVVTGAGALACAVLTGQWPLSILGGLAVEMLVGLMTWQYVVLAGRLDGLAERARVDLQYAHQLLRETCKDQARLLETVHRIESGLADQAEALDGRISREFQATAERLAELHGMLADEANGIRGRIDGLRESVREQFAETQQQLDRYMPLESRKETAAALERFEQNAALLQAGLEQVAAAITEFARWDPHDGASKATAISTAIDRLNLEVRRQLAIISRKLED